VYYYKKKAITTRIRTNPSETNESGKGTSSHSYPIIRSTYKKKSSRENQTRIITPVITIHTRGMTNITSSITRDKSREVQCKRIRDRDRSYTFIATIRKNSSEPQGKFLRIGAYENFSAWPSNHRETRTRGKKDALHLTKWHYQNLSNDRFHLLER